MKFRQNYLCQNETCKKEFIPKDRRSVKFCSQICCRNSQHIDFINREKEYNKNSILCKNCDKPLSYKRSKSNYNKFCTKSCAAIFNNTGRMNSQISKNKVSNTLKDLYENYEKPRNGITKSCYPHSLVLFQNCCVCNKLFSKKRHLKTKSCSIECNNKLHILSGQASAKVQKRRSKDEIKLYELIKPLVKCIEHNERMFEGWDADILLPDYKIAISWNGPWHYKDMKGFNHTYKQTHNRDIIKRKVLHKNGWKFLIFEDRYWRPEQAFEIIKKLVLPERVELIIIGVMSTVSYH